MTAWRIVGSLILGLALVPSARSQTYSLMETVQPGDHFHLRLDMTLTGTITVYKNGKAENLKLIAAATHEFPERILVVGSNGIPQKTARYYQTARAAITAGSDRTERTLREDRRLLVAQHYKDQATVYCPKGALLREELELTSEHFDTLVITGLLPGKEVALNATWKVTNEIAQSLCNFQGLTAQDLTCTLKEVKDDVATVSITGTATGIDQGALVKLQVDSSYQYDLTKKRVVSINWKEKDQRDQSPVNPASQVESTTTVKRSMLEGHPELTDVALISVPENFDLPPTVTQLSFADPKSPFRLLYPRDWQVVGQTGDHLIMRLLDRGDLIAQVTISPWTKAKPGEHITPEAFHTAMASTPGWEQGDIVQTGVVPADNGRWVYRISAMGKMDGIKLMQNFYVVADPNGDQVVLAFTMTQAQAEKLGTRDLTLVSGLDLERKPAK